MTYARQIIPGRTYFVSKRCLEQRHFWRPDAFTNAIFRFCLAHAAAKYRIQLHAFCVMSNHWHAVLTDPHGHLPVFMEWVHKYTAKCFNARTKRRENVWSIEAYSAIVLDTEDALIDKIVYTELNPVTAGLVRKATQWPGLSSASLRQSSTQSISTRPDYFRPHGPVAEQATLTLEVPSFVSGSPETFWHTIDTLVAEGEAALRRRTPKVLGAHAVLRIPYHTQPKRLQTRYARHLHLSGKGKDLLLRAKQRLREFRQAYQDAYARFKQGIHSTVFPAGTYWLKHHAAVQCVPCTLTDTAY